MKRWVLLGWLFMGLAGLFAWACSGGKAASDGDADDGAGNGTSVNQGGSGGAGTGGDIFSGGNTSVSVGGGLVGTIDVNPKNLVFDVSPGNTPTQDYTAHYNGQDVTDQVLWVYDKPQVGEMDGNTLTLSGTVGGIGKVRALLDMAQGETDATVNVTVLNNTANVTPQEQMGFDNPAGPDPTMNIVYPFSGTVMPLRVAAPEIQWTGVGANDLYRLRMTSNHVTYTEYFTTFAMKTLQQQIWEDIQFSGEGPFSDPLTVELSRRVGNTYYQPKTFTLHIAQGFVRGYVYYWQLPATCQGGNFNGQILRITPDNPQTEQFFNTNQCWGCHSVSRDGQSMMASFDISFPFSLQTIDLAQFPAQQGPITQGTGLGGTFSAWNDSSTRVIFSDNGTIGSDQTYLHIVDSQTGGYVVQNAIGPGCGEPAWSPDGTKIAAVCGMSGGSWTFDSYSGNLTLIDIMGDTLGASTQIVPQGQPGRPAYPSFTPDSQYLLFGRPTQGSRSTGNGALYITDINGQNTKWLQALDPGNDNRAFNPGVAPRKAGGFSWVVFISRRNYGNQLVNMNRQQLWMAAVDDPPNANDPSHPPFYLRGQEMCDLSENAYYAQEPCLEEGEPCEAGVECCEGNCIPDLSQQSPTGFICGDPDPNECVQTGNACENDADCCDYPEVICLDGFCEPLPPM
jgi:hypothetical protein